MQKLAGIITEGEYKEKLQTVREEEGVDDIKDPKLDKIEDEVESELGKNPKLLKPALDAIKSLQKDTGLSLKDMTDREKVLKKLALNEASVDQISKGLATLFGTLSASSGAVGAGMKIVGGVGGSHANASLFMAAFAAGIATYLWNYSKHVDQNT
jgi:hypothetical protein